PSPNRFEKGHSLHRHCDNACLRHFCGENAATQIHLRCQPAAENVTIRVRVLGHGNGLDDQLTFRLIDVVHSARRITHICRVDRAVPCSMSKGNLLLASRITSPAERRIHLNDQHAIAVAVEAVAFANCLPVGPKQKLAAGKCTYEHEQSRSRQMKIRKKQIEMLKSVWWIDEEIS